MRLKDRQILTNRMLAMTGPVNKAWCVAIQHAGDHTARAATILQS